MKNVLIISVGLSPQVVTETVYALVCESGVSVDEVHLWTTTDGARAIERTLLDGGKGALYRLFADYGLKHAVVYTRVFGKVKDAPSYLGLSLDRPLEDIRSLADNQLVADTLMHFIQEQAADPSRRLLCCLAGARKTIGVYLALALQFFGRESDRLFHVLVRPELENDPSFFYPPPGTPPGVIELVEVPIAFLREYFNVLQTPSGPRSYSELVAQVQDELALLKRPHILRVSPPSRVSIGGKAVRLSPLQFALYAAFAARRVRCGEGCHGCPRCFVPLQEIQNAGLYEPLKKVISVGGFKDHRLEQLRRWSTREPDVEHRLAAFRETVSRVNRKVGDGPARRMYRIVRASVHDQSAYGIELSPAYIALSPALLEIWDV